MNYTNRHRQLDNGRFQFQIYSRVNVILTLLIFQLQLTQKSEHHLNMFLYGLKVCTALVASFKRNTVIPVWHPLHLTVYQVMAVGLTYLTDISFTSGWCQGIT